MPSIHSPESVEDTSGRGRAILLAWEVSEGFAHAARLPWIVRQLRRTGRQPVIDAHNPETLRADYAPLLAGL